MFLASFLIGLREGLEAALVVSVLLVFVSRAGRNDVRRRIWFAVGLAVGPTAAVSAVSTFGRSKLTFEAQEIIGGTMSLIAVVMITGMVFWMLDAGTKLKTHLEEGAARALVSGTGIGIFWIAFVSVGREGVETTLMLWGWASDPMAISGALTGILVAIALGCGLYFGSIRFDFATFFTWSSGFLIIVCAGVLAYGIHDLQEAAVLPGPFSGEPITPTHPRTGEVLTGFADYPFWGAAYPFGWAFNVEEAIDPAGFLAALLKGTVGFVPQMTWLEVTAWAVYMAFVVPAYIRHVRRIRTRVRARAEDRAQVQDDAAAAGTQAHDRTPTAAGDHPSPVTDTATAVPPSNTPN